MAHFDLILYEIGKNVVSVRDLRRLTSSELAARAGLSEDRLKEIELGFGVVKGHELLSIANALDVSASDLLGELRAEDAQEFMCARGTLERMVLCIKVGAGSNYVRRLMRNAMRSWQTRNE